MKYKLIHGDCLKVMQKIKDNSIDLILCDLPYGTTICKWDTVIDFESLWSQYKRIIKKHCAIVLFGQEPFSSALRLSNIEWFKYDWYWRKSKPSGFMNAKLKPLKDIEIISVFSNGVTSNCSPNNMKYYPQGLIDVDYIKKRPQLYRGSEGITTYRKNHKLERKVEKTGYPRQVLEFANPNSDVLHPTQKPVDLLEYLIKTYSDLGNIVLDNCMGSGSTGVACVNTGRRFVGIEKEEKYYKIAKSRLEVIPRKIF